MTKAWQKRVDENRPHHGLGSSDYLPGNVQHLVSPIVGNMRLIMASGDTVKPSEVDFWIDRLMFVLEIAREADENDRSSTG